MANHVRDEGAAVHQPLDHFDIPVLVTALATWPWLGELWDHMPGPTACYMGVSAAFMLFQMCDKMGLLERFKRRRLLAPPEREH